MEASSVVQGLESISPEELVVMQLLEEIRRLVLLPGGTDTPGAVNPRRMAAAKLYLDTRDTFEVVERQIEEHVHEKPKLLRKLSKRASMNSVTSVTSGDGATASPNATPRFGACQTSSVASPRLNEQVIDRIQEMFRELGQMLGAAILRELQQRRLTLQSILHYVRFLPAEFQWTAYSDARREEVAAAYRSPKQQQQPSYQVGAVGVGPNASIATSEPSSAGADDEQGAASVAVLKRHAEFVKHQIRKDVDTVCLFSANGTLSTIFGDDVATIQENVADKFESLLTSVYSQYLVPPLEAQMDNLIQYSDQWSREMAEAAVATTVAVTAAAASGTTTSSTEPLSPYATYYARPRRYRSKLNIFSDHLGGIDDRFATVLLPPVPPGQHVKLLVADDSRVGVWWQKSVFSASERDVSTLHNDELRKISSRVESLDGHIYAVLLGNMDLAAQFDQSARRFSKHAWVAKWLGQRVLVNNGRDSLWLEVRITDVDERKCKLRLKKSLENCALLESSSLAQLIRLGEWVSARELHFVGVPVCPDFRTFMGLRFREILELMQSVVVEISSIFPNGELSQKVRSALWSLVEPSVGKGEHIFSRYFRSTLQLDVFSNANERRMMYASLAYMRSRGSSLGRSATLKSIAAIAEAGVGHNSIGSNGSASVGRNGSTSSASAPAAESQGREGDAVPSSRVKPTFTPSFTSPGVFNSSGRYETGMNDASFSSGSGSNVSHLGLFGSRLSPFEKLSHHLLEETEVVSACIQAHSIAVSRALVQVLAEKVSKVRRRSSEKLRYSGGGAGGLTLEQVLAEYASAYRLLHVWRVCRHELDTVPRQRRAKLSNSSTSAIHFKWVDRTFERMESELLETIDTLAHFVHRAYFHECVSYVLPGVFEQAWTASKPWFSNSRCTYAVQAWVFRFQSLLERVSGSILCKYERSLGVHEKLHKLASTMLFDVFASLAEAYATLEVSRARLTQWKMDVLYLVCGVHKLLRLLDRMASARVPQLKKSTAPLSRVRLHCLRLLEHVAVRCGPGDVVLEAVKKKRHGDASAAASAVGPDNTSPRSGEGDLSIELESHISVIYSSLDAMSLLSASVLVESNMDVLWQAHSIFQDVDLRRLADVQLNWAALVNQSRLARERLGKVLQQRHEVGEWAFPPLTEEQLQFRNRLQQFLKYGDEHERSVEAENAAASLSTTKATEEHHDAAASTPAPSEIDPATAERYASGPPSAMIRELPQPDPSGAVEQPTPYQPSHEQPSHEQPSHEQPAEQPAEQPSSELHQDEQHLATQAGEKEAELSSSSTEPPQRITDDVNDGGSASEDGRREPLELNPTEAIY